jgi:hypothetical protein
MPSQAPINTPMGTFAASLRTIGDVKSLAATIELADARLKIVAGDTEIGSWPLSDIHLEEIPTGYRMTAEGDQVLLEMKDVAAFTAALADAEPSSKGLSFRRKKEPRKRKTEPKKATKDTAKETNEPPRHETPAVPAPSPAAPAPARVDVEEKTVKAGSRPDVLSRVMDNVDTILIKGQKKFGAYLPGFVFSRAMFFIGLSAIVMAVLMPNLFSTLLVAAGCLLVLYGAVVYSDSVLASKWLPGRATPQHALLSGIAVLIVGVLLGVIAK